MHLPSQSTRAYTKSFEVEVESWRSSTLSRASRERRSGGVVEPYRLQRGGQLLAISRDSRGRSVTVVSAVCGVRCVVRYVMVLVECRRHVLVPWVCLLSGDWT